MSGPAATADLSVKEDPGGPVVFESCHPTFIHRNVCCKICCLNMNILERNTLE